MTDDWNEFDQANEHIRHKQTWRASVPAPQVPVVASIPLVYFDEDGYQEQMEEWFATHNPCCGGPVFGPCLEGCECYGCKLRAKNVGQITENGPKG